MTSFKIQNNWTNWEGGQKEYIFFFFLFCLTFLRCVKQIKLINVKFSSPFLFNISFSFSIDQSFFTLCVHSWSPSCSNHWFQLSACLTFLHFRFWSSSCSPHLFQLSLCWCWLDWLSCVWLFSTVFRFWCPSCSARWSQLCACWSVGLTFWCLTFLHSVLVFWYLGV